MGNENFGKDKSIETDKAGETKLRGEALKGPEQPGAVDHVEFEKKRNPDTVLRVDNEKDTLYDDGLDVQDDSQTLAGTHGNVIP